MAESIGASFRLTSAFKGVGINELFEEMGKKYLERFGNIALVKNETMKLNKKELSQLSQNKKKKRECCKWVN